jgi:SAM-dependent methyltransferase
MIYCFDIDGTICTNTDGTYDQAEPFPGVISQVNALFDAGHRIIFFTARGSTTDIDWRPLTERQLADWKVRYHELRFGKPHADLFIDDKAVNPWHPGTPRDLAGLRLPKPPSPGVVPAGDVLRDGAYLDVTYAANRAPRSDYPRRLTALLHQRFFQRPGRLLDIGCGCGDHLDGFHHAGHEVCGVDISPRAAELAKGHQVLTVDLENGRLPFPPCSFDFVFSKSVIEHLHHPVALLSQAREVLKPGGVAVIMTPSWQHTYWGPFYIDHTHVSPFTRPSLEDALRLAGFRTLQVEEFLQLPVVWQFPVLAPVLRLLALLPLPYRPMSDAPWSESLNTHIRFAKEVMLLAVATKEG